MSDSPAVILYDKCGNPVLVSSDGVYAINVSDMETREILKKILNELEKMNFHLSYITENDL